MGREPPCSAPGRALLPLPRPPPDLPPVGRPCRPPPRSLGALSLLCWRGAADPVLLRVASAVAAPRGPGGAQAGPWETPLPLPRVPFSPHAPEATGFQNVPADTLEFTSKPRGRQKGATISGPVLQLHGRTRCVPCTRLTNSRVDITQGAPP